MTDREKIIKGTEICLSGGTPQRCIECPYHNDGCDRQRMIDTLELLKEQETANLYKCPNCGTWVSAENVVRCKDCKHGSPYCTEDVCGETLIECNRPDLGDVIEIHGWKWFCADGERKEGR